MLRPDIFIDALRINKITFFTGVPDSLLKDFLSCLCETISSDAHITAANEGNAVALATGYHLATGNMACVYMQNSGLGNAINPLVSLTDREVYAIPMLLVIGWRGEPGVNDEPQHRVQGRITPGLLDTLSIPYIIVSPDTTADTLCADIIKLTAMARTQSRPCAVLVRKGAFEKHGVPMKYPTDGDLTREEAIACLVDCLESNDIVVSTTGKISRELNEIRQQHGTSSGQDFLTVGSMGHASQIALGIAHQKKDRTVYCLDGDGAVIMHMGALATVGWVAPHNFRHIVLNNMAHESVGGQPTAAQVVDFVGVARSCGYPLAATASRREELTEIIETWKKRSGPALLDVKVSLASRANLGRPAANPVENKLEFMSFVGS